jgi:peptidoglycan/xylan/chitin deacetylase (PgdA/CDA1 family)
MSILVELSFILFLLENCLDFWDHHKSDGFDHPSVTLAFDDGDTSQQAHAVSVLEQYGWNGTFYIVTSWIDTPSYITTDQLIRLKDSGHEIGSHTVTHPWFWKYLPGFLIRSELQNSQRTLKNMCGTGINSFASPYGFYGRRIINESKKYYTNHRTVDYGFNTRSFDRHRIKVQEVLIHITPQQVGKWIQFAQEQNYWLVLLYHRINESAEKWSTTPASFKEQMSILAKLDIPVLTMNNALAKIEQLPELYSRDRF